MPPTFKLPHGALVALSLVSMLLAWLVAHNASGDVVLPAAALAIIPIVQTVIGMLAPSVVTSTNVLAAKRAAATGLVGMLLMALVVLGCSSCTTQQGVQVATVAVDTIVCVLDHETDAPLTIVTECGLPDVQSVMTILDAHKAAETRELVARSSSVADAGPAQ